MMRMVLELWEKLVQELENILVFKMELTFILRMWAALIWTLPAGRCGRSAGFRSAA